MNCRSCKFFEFKDWTEMPSKSGYCSNPKINVNFHGKRVDDGNIEETTPVDGLSCNGVDVVANTQYVKVGHSFGCIHFSKSRS